MSKGEDDAEALGAAVLHLMRAARRTRSRPVPTAALLSIPQLVILDAIDRGGGSGISAVATEAGLSQPTVSRALPTLERAGLVRRSAHVDDGRASTLELTDEGRVLVTSTRDWLSDRVAALWAALSTDERPLAPGLLAKVTTFILDELR